MHITQLEVENIKRLSAVSITPDGHTVVIGGKNGAGKSSVLDAIMYALAGGRELPKVPIRNGADKAKIELTLSGDDGKPPLKVTRVFTDKGSRLEVSYDDEHKAKLSNPQAILDTLCSRVAFDPLAFTRAKPREQAEQLRALVGLDFSALDASRAKLFADRTDVNREAKALKARLDAMPTFADASDEPVSVGDLMAKLEAAQSTNQRKSDAERDARSAESAIAAIVSETKSIVRKIEDLKRQLQEAESQLAENERDRAAAETRAKELRQAADSMPEVDCDPIHEQIRNAESVNEQVRGKKEYIRLTEEHATLTTQSDGLTAQLEAIDADKQRQLSAAEWPVEGLGFDADGVTLNGLPFDQASAAEQLRVSVAMGFAANPRLRVILIRDASLLDAESLAMVADLAEQHNGQCWIERVGDGAECSLVIEDGAVREEAVAA